MAMESTNETTNSPKRSFLQSRTFNGSMGVLDFGLTYADRRNRLPEESKLKSGTIAGASAAAWMYAPSIMWAKTALDMGKAAGGMIENYRLQSYEEQYRGMSNRGVMGQGFQDTDVAHTSRQRGMQAIQNSRLNARSALANEARSLHRF